MLKCVQGTQGHVNHEKSQQWLHNHILCDCIIVHGVYVLEHKLMEQSIGFLIVSVIALCISMFSLFRSNTRNKKEIVHLYKSVIHLNEGMTLLNQRNTALVDALEVSQRMLSKYVLKTEEIKNVLHNHIKSHDPLKNA